MDYTILTIVVSVMDPKLLMKMLQVTLTGGPDRSRLSSCIIVIDIIDLFCGDHMKCGDQIGQNVTAK